MKDLIIMSAIQVEEQKAINKAGIPALDAEGAAVMSAKRVAIDEPNTEVKQDPLR